MKTRIPLLLKALALYVRDALHGIFVMFVIGAIVGMGVALGFALVLGWIAPKARAAESVAIAIPRAAEQYRADLIRAAHADMGLDAPTALLAAQIHQESRWNPSAKSPVGAQGLAQFMPATARWLPSVAPQTGKPLPFNPGWALRALVAYDCWLYRRIEHTLYDCERWAFTLCAYNGGLGWVNRDRARAALRGIDPTRYWGSVEKVNAGRSAANFRENRGYPARIFTLQTAYERQGWGPGVQCEARP